MYFHRLQSIEGYRKSDNTCEQWGWSLCHSQRWCKILFRAYCPMFVETVNYTSILSVHSLCVHQAIRLFVSLYGCEYSSQICMRYKDLSRLLVWGSTGSVYRKQNKNIFHNNPLDKVDVTLYLQHLLHFILSQCALDVSIISGKPEVHPKSLLVVKKQLVVFFNFSSQWV